MPEEPKKGAVTGGQSSTIEAEIGRINIVTSSEMVPAHQPKERINTLVFTNFAMKLGIEMSFHHATSALNAVLRRAETKGDL